MMAFFVLTAALAAFNLVEGRQFRDTGVGSIIFEEAWTTPELVGQMQYVPFPQTSHTTSYQFV